MPIAFAVCITTSDKARVVYAPSFVGLELRPCPGRSMAMARNPAALSTGSVSENEYTDAPQPCTRTTD